MTRMKMAGKVQGRMCAGAVWLNTSSVCNGKGGQCGPKKTPKDIKEGLSRWVLNGINEDPGSNSEDQKIVVARRQDADGNLKAGFILVIY